MRSAGTDPLFSTSISNILSTMESLTKKQLFIWNFILIFAGCSTSEAPSDEILTGIAAVENGLSPEILIEGDQTWTIQERMSHYGVPGVSLAIINNFEIEVVKAYGIMDSTSREWVTPATLFQAGSISKPVAAYGALKLVEEGKLSLEENVNKYLISWKLPDNEFTNEKPIALKNLLNHSGGVTVHGFLGYRPGLEVPNLMQVLDGETPANSNPIRVDMAPETQFRYSGGGYCIMQQILIDVEKKSFPEILKAKVLDTLNMIHSTYEQPLPPDKLVFAATGYLPNRKEVIGKRHTYPEMAAAGLWTTAEDLAKFAIDIQRTVKGESEQVLSKEMVDRMLTPYVSDFCGLGIFLNQFGEETYFGHGGWDEGFSSELVAHKNKGYGVVVLTNSNHPDFIRELIRSVARVYQWEGYVEPVYSRKEISSEVFQQVIGKYQLHPNLVADIYERDGKLYGLILEEEKPEELVMIDDRTFVRRTGRNKIRFLLHPETGDRHLVMLQNEDDDPEFKYPKITDGRKLPIEWVREKNYAEALKAFQALQQTQEGKEFASESRINGLGYNLMNNNLLEEAIVVFRVNAAMYPDGFNVYDSLGEAYMNKGMKEEAVKNYKKSLELNPDNSNAVEMLKRLEGNANG